MDFKKLYLFGFLSLLFFLGCQENDDTKIIEELIHDHIHEIDSGYKIREIKVSDLNVLTEFVSRSLDDNKRNTGNSDYVVTDFGWIELDNVIEVTDTNGNTNYTFAVYPNVKAKGKFYNLIFSVDTIGNEYSYLAEFVMNDDFSQQYEQGLVALDDFQGEVRKYSLDILNNTNSRNLDTTDCTEQQDPSDISSPDCVEMVEGSGDTQDDSGADPTGDTGDTNGSGTSGGGTTGGGSDGTSGDTSGGNTSGTGSDDGGTGVSVGVMFLCNWQNDLHSSPSECNNPSAGGTWVIQYAPSGRSVSCGGTGGTAVTPVAFDKLGIELGLTPDESACLEQNCEIKNQIHGYLNSTANGITVNEESVDFANTVIDILNEDCDKEIEVDFLRKVILEGIEGECQKSLIIDAYSGCGPLAELFQEVFQSEDGLPTIIFKETNLPPLNAGNTDYTPTSSNPFVFTINLNIERLYSATQLDIINTVIHEYTHALLYYWFLTGGFNTDVSNPASYDTLVQQFALHRELIGVSNQTQHEYMDALVDDIALISYQWAINEGGYDPNIVTLEYMKKIAWGGLNNSDTFELLYPESSSQWWDVVNAQINEAFPNDIGNTPLGNPCN